MGTFSGMQLCQKFWQPIVTFQKGRLSVQKNKQELIKMSPFS